MEFSYRDVSPTPSSHVTTMWWVNSSPAARKSDPLPSVNTPVSRATMSATPRTNTMVSTTKGYGELLFVGYSGVW